MEALIAATEIERSSMKVSPPTSPASSSLDPYSSCASSSLRTHFCGASSSCVEHTPSRNSKPESRDLQRELPSGAVHLYLPGRPIMDHHGPGNTDHPHREPALEDFRPSAPSSSDLRGVHDDTYLAYPTMPFSSYSTVASANNLPGNTLYHQPSTYALETPNSSQTPPMYNSSLPAQEPPSSTFAATAHSYQHAPPYHHQPQFHQSQFQLPQPPLPQPPLPPVAHHAPSGLPPRDMLWQQSRLSSGAAYQHPSPQASQQSKLEHRELNIPKQGSSTPSLDALRYADHNSESVPLASEAHLRAARTAASEAILALGTCRTAKFTLSSDIIRATHLAEAPRRGDRVLPGNADTSVAACYMLGGTPDDDLQALLNSWNLIAPRNTRVKAAESMYKDRVKDLIASLNERGTRESRAENLAALRVCEVIADILDGHTARTLVTAKQKQDQEIADLQAQVLSLQQQLAAASGASAVPAASNKSSSTDAPAYVSSSMTC